MVEQAVWEGYKETGSPKTKEYLILQYAPLVRDLARGFRYRTPNNIEYADLVGYGFLGLIDAVDKFDPGRGIDFTAYARIRISGAIADGIRSERRLPRSAQVKARHISKTYDSLAEKLHRPPDEREMAEHLGMDINKYRRILTEIENSYVVSLDDLFVNAENGNGDLSILDLIRDENAEDPLDITERKDLHAIVRANIDRLPEREKLIVYLYYCEEMSMKEVGEVLEITESRVSQIHGEAISHLRTLLAPQLEPQPA
ncbi:MAG: FliA/WhiG family RNA polymerase sigma factor [Actinobacteria bacterium]|jgi:RNA polymerase sigma factor for flagellar operon FliA|nr:MAG: FliA/WhiG family RNA polymerase sigma factor [Actinomycetota bacterium]